MEMAFFRNKALINGAAVQLLSTSTAIAQSNDCSNCNYTARGFEKKFKIPCLTYTDYLTFLIRSARENTQISNKIKVATKVVD